MGGRPRLDGRLWRVGRAAVAVGAAPPSGPAVQEVAARAARGGRTARGTDCGGCTRGRDAGAYAHPARVRPPARLVRRAAPRHLAAADRAHPHRRRRRRPFGRAAARALPSRLRAARIRALAHARRPRRRQAGRRPRLNRRALARIARRASAARRVGPPARRAACCGGAPPRGGAAAPRPVGGAAAAPSHPCAIPIHSGAALSSPH